VRRTLHYTTDETYYPEVANDSWEFKHQAPGAPFPLPVTPNVMPDLAAAMKYDPNLKICLNGGYFDLATPFFEGIYEMHHLTIPEKLQGNIEYHYYESGHMVYANETSLKQIHDNVAAFIRKTDNQAGE
jgi:carboxypeptidase C (cathepsin A)